VIHARQRGIALLVAILMFALATTLAAAITYSKAMAARRAAATFTMEQALQAGMAAESLAGIALETNGGSSQTHLAQEWAQPLGPVEIEGTGVWLQAQVEDLNDRFNLNSLVKWSAPDNTFIPDDHQIAIFRKLLIEVDVEDRWADLMVDWIDPDIAPYGAQGGEDTLYLSQNPPYRPPNTFITHTSELLALPGFGPERFAKIAPYVTALPIDAKVNVCTAKAQVLDATRNDGQTEFIHVDLSVLRQKGCSPLSNAYLNGINDATLKGEVTNRVEEKSSWFRLRSHVRIGTAEFVLYSVLFREPNTNKVRTVQRSFGSE
jgi:general secretion pathway protein K